MNKRQLQPNQLDAKFSLRPKKQASLVRATVVGIGLGLVICLVAAFLIPLPDDESSERIEGIEQPTVVGANAPDKPLPQPSATIELPSGETSVNVALLQDELKLLAEQLTNDYPAEAASFHFAAQIFFELKQSEIAEARWRKCISFSPRYMGPYVGLATLLMEKGRNEEAIEVLDQAKSLGGNSPEMLQKLGEAFENMGEIEKSQSVLEQGVHQFPEEAGLWQALGRIQNQAGRPADAEVSLRRSINLGGENEPLLFALNAAVMRQGKTQESAEIREAIAKLKRPKQFEQDVFQAKYDTALTHIAVDVMISVATFLQTQGKRSAAKALLLRAAQLEPKNIGAYQVLLSIARQQNQLADQQLLIQKLIELDPQNVVNFTNLASLAVQVGDSRRAEEALKAAVAIDPQGVLAQAASAKLYLSLGKIELARSMATQVVERQPSAAAYRLLAATYKAEGLQDAYVAANRKADELDKDVQTTTTP